jgi:hypothetical protein
MISPNAAAPGVLIPAVPVPGVLVIGGSGAFGGRLVDGLIATSNFAVVIAGRELARAEAKAASLGARARAMRLDAATATAAALRASGAFVVVDAAGPFQGASYRLARAAIEAGLHYVDLADGRGFVAGFAAALDDAARAAGVVALTGASSTPALSHAVLDRLTAGWRAIDTVEIAISPGNRSAPRGLSVIRAILSYVGRPVRVFAHGEWTERTGWGWPVRRLLPGLGRRWLSLCETPDLDLVPARFTPQRSAMFRAGMELAVVHWGLCLVGLLVWGRLLPAAPALARPLRWAAERLRHLGSDRGGMLVEATGLNAAGRAVRATWSLVAEAGDGPSIPGLPALAAIRALADGRLASPGARPCVGVLDLAAIEREFARYRIATEVTTSAADADVPVPAPARR